MLSLTNCLRLLASYYRFPFFAISENNWFQNQNQVGTKKGT